MKSPPCLAFAGRVAVLLVPLVVATPVYAGMTQDLASCTAAEGQGSAAACTRVMRSGRLPRGQFYIGHFNRGSSYRQAGDLTKALADFNQVVALKPHFSRGYHMRALVHYALGDRKKALSDIDRAIKLDAKDWSTYFSRAALLRADGDFDAALADLSAAQDLKPKKHEVLLLRALIKADKGDYGAARADVNKVIAEGSVTAAGYYARAAIAYQERRFDAATADLDRALARQADLAAAHMLWGRVLEARADTAAAKKHYRQALAAPSTNFDGLFAHKTARARLDALGAGASANVALNNGSTPSVGCKRFLPATGTIITADCDE